MFYPPLASSGAGKGRLLFFLSIPKAHHFEIYINPVIFDAFFICNLLKFGVKFSLIALSKSYWAILKQCLYRLKTRSN
jgi:hypothetical protein